MNFDLTEEQQMMVDQAESAMYMVARDLETQRESGGCRKATSR